MKTKTSVRKSINETSDTINREPKDELTPEQLAIRRKFTAYARETMKGKDSRDLLLNPGAKMSKRGKEILKGIGGSGLFQNITERHQSHRHL
jgi:hypothetical protein